MSTTPLAEELSRQGHRVSQRTMFDLLTQLNYSPQSTRKTRDPTAIWPEERERCSIVKSRDAHSSCEANAFAARFIHSYGGARSSPAFIPFGLLADPYTAVRR